MEYNYSKLRIYHIRATVVLVSTDTNSDSHVITMVELDRKCCISRLEGKMTYLLSCMILCAVCYSEI